MTTAPPLLLPLPCVPFLCPSIVFVKIFIIIMRVVFNHSPFPKSAKHLLQRFPCRKATSQVLTVCLQEKSDRWRRCSNTLTTYSRSFAFLLLPAFPSCDAFPCPSPRSLPTRSNLRCFLLCENQGNHVLLREFEFVNATPRNRLALIRNFVETYRANPPGSESFPSPSISSQSKRRKRA